MWTIVSTLASEGVVPVMMSIPPKADATKNARVPMYNRIVKALAEAQQLPYFDLHAAMVGLPSMGLAGDGIHLNTYVNGGARGCVLTSAGLQFGHNVRNELQLRALDRVRKVLIADAPGTDDPGPAPTGAGTAASPFDIEALPYVHTANSDDGTRTINQYTGDCTNQNEGGPEMYYKFVTENEVTVRAMVLTPGTSVDIDVHILDTAPQADRCMARNDSTFTETLAPGTYWFALDTFVSSTAGEKPGEYIFVLESI
jgi:hypothetical protein